MTETKLSRDVFQQAITHASVFYPDARLRVKNNGIEIHSVDPAEKGAVTVFLEKQACDSFSSSKTEIKVDLDRLRVLSSVIPDDTIQEIDITIDNKLFSIANSGDVYQEQGLRRTFRQIPSPESAPSAVITFLPGQFWKATRLANMISYDVRLFVSKADDTFALIAKESKLGDDRLRYEFETVDIGLERNTIQALFPADKLVDVAKIIPNNDTVQISLRERGPAVLQYTFANGHGHTTIVLRQKTAQ